MKSDSISQFRSLSAEPNIITKLKSNINLVNKKNHSKQTKKIEGMPELKRNSEKNIKLPKIGSEKNLGLDYHIEYNRYESNESLI